VFREQITQQEHRAADLARAAFHVEELKRMRQDVLAACATGDSAESALQDIEAKIRVAETECEASTKAIERCRETATGLRRLVDEAEVELTPLLESRPALWRKLLHAKAEIESESYVGQAIALRESLMRLHGIIGLMEQIGTSTSHLRSRNVDAQVPLFRFEAFKIEGPAGAKRFPTIASAKDQLFEPSTFQERRQYMTSVREELELQAGVALADQDPDHT